jgi:hypothetical protein
LKETPSKRGSPPSSFRSPDAITTAIAQRLAAPRSGGD